MASFLTALEGEGLRLGRFADNGLPLPASEELAAAIGHALHRGPHPAYSDVVTARLDQIRSTTSLSQQRERWAATARIMTLQRALRRALTDRHPCSLWLNRRDSMRMFVDRAYLDAAIKALFGTD